MSVPQVRAAARALFGTAWFDGTKDVVTDRKRRALEVVRKAPPGTDKLSLTQQERLYKTMSQKPKSTASECPETPQPLSIPAAPPPKALKPQPPAAMTLLRRLQELRLPQYPPFRAGHPTRDTLNDLKAWGITVAETAYPTCNLRQLESIRFDVSTRFKRKRGEWKHIVGKHTVMGEEFHIRLDDKLLKEEREWPGVCNTVLHEFAHHLTNTNFCGSRGPPLMRYVHHGAEWKRVYISIGGSGKTRSSKE